MRAKIICVYFPCQTSRKYSYVNLWFKICTKIFKNSNVAVRSTQSFVRFYALNTRQIDIYVHTNKYSALIPHFRFDVIFPKTTYTPQKFIARKMFSGYCIWNEKHWKCGVYQRILSSSFSLQIENEPLSPCLASFRLAPVPDLL